MMNASNLFRAYMTVPLLSGFGISNHYSSLYKGNEKRFFAQRLKTGKTLFILGGFPSY